MCALWGRTPAQAEIKLTRKPRQPSWLPGVNLSLGFSKTPDRWRIYLKLDRNPDADPEPEDI